MDAAINHSDWRRNAIQHLGTDTLDVLVVGGGIVGAGIARDSAMRGLRTGLIEQYDFASGTTDTDFSGNIEAVRTHPEDIDYILSVVNSYFPELKMTETDLISTWAGVRPLIAAAGGHPSAVSRSHRIIISPDGWLDAAGGKLTTYCLMAEESVNKLARFLNHAVPPCRTHQEVLLEADDTGGKFLLIGNAVTV